MNLKFNNSNLKISLFLSVAVYLITFLVLNIIEVSSGRLADSQEVYLDFRSYEKQIVKEESIKIPIQKQKPRSYQKEVEKKELNKVDTAGKAVVTFEKTDSNLFTESDVVVKNNNWLDSMVIKNPNILMLKYAVTDQLKNNSIEKSDSAKIVEKLRNAMQIYFRIKYPTPVHKFGDGSPGIPIDKILDIFSADDTVDVDKIKRYLKLEGYK